LLRSAKDLAGFQTLTGLGMLVMGSISPGRSQSYFSTPIQAALRSGLLRDTVGTRSC